MTTASTAEVMGRRSEIIRRALGLDYGKFAHGPLRFDYEGLMQSAGYSLDEVRRIQAESGVGRTPLLELRNMTALARELAPAGKGARILLKDEAANPSGSFKARRAALAVHDAAARGYRGVVAATSGNYGAAVASQAAMCGLRCIVVQEAFDSRGLGQPEILEKGRACEAYGAEVVQLTVGPELFHVFLAVLEETGFYNASLYTPHAVAGIETLGAEVAEEVRARFGRHPDVCVITHAGGGNVTGTARGLQKVGAAGTEIVGVSVDLGGLHMASDRDFNRKSFTTGHSGFGIPFATQPDRVDVPRNAARSLRYLDRLVHMTQGEVFYATEMLAKLEGLERGPAGNTSLAAAFVLAQRTDCDRFVVVQETEYTGAGKHPLAQLTFARQNGVEVRRGDPRGNVPGKAIVIPEHPGQLTFTEVALKELRASYVRNAVRAAGVKVIGHEDIAFLMQETRAAEPLVRGVLAELEVSLVA